MRWEWRTALATVLLVLLIAGPTSMVSGTQERYDHADSAPHSLYHSLNLTITRMVDSLDLSRMVNYSLEYREGVGKDGAFNVSFDEEELDLSIERAGGIDVLNVTGILQDLQGRVPSYQFVRDEYQPFHSASTDLGNYSERHRSFLLNITSALEHYNEWSLDGNTSELDIRTLDSFHNASFHLNNMGNALDRLEGDVQRIDGQTFDVTGLEGSLDACDMLVEEYRGMMRDILNHTHSMPDSLTLHSPSTLHPGEDFEVGGTYVLGGEFGVNRTVSILLDGEEVSTGRTDKNGYYSVQLEVPWDRPLGEMILKASAGNVSSERTSLVTKWKTDLHLTAGEGEYYHETIGLGGSFLTAAPVPMEGIDLSGPEGVFHPSLNGSFRLELDSTNLSLGHHTVTVGYEGNGTMLPSSSSVSFDVSVPTEMVIDDLEDKYDAGDEMAVQGRLLNASSGEGIPGREILLTVDGERTVVLQTDDDGEFRFNSTIGDIGLGEGQHVATFTFDDDEVYRDVRKSTDFRVTEEGILPGIGDENLLLIIIPLSALSIWIVHRALGRREGEVLEIHEVEEGRTPREELPAASSREEVHRVYGSLLQSLSSKGLIDVPRGRTARDLAKDLKLVLGLEGEIDRITEVFERAHFSRGPVSEEDLEAFNRSVRRIEKGASS